MPKTLRINVPKHCGEDGGDDMSSSPCMITSRHICGSAKCPSSIAIKGKRRIISGTTKSPAWPAHHISTHSPITLTRKTTGLHITQIHCCLYVLTLRPLLATLAYS